jgi:dipeptidase
MKRILLAALLPGLAVLSLPRGTACSTLLAGRLASADGSVLMSHSCDGDVMGLVYVMPAQSYPPRHRLPMYWDHPANFTRIDREQPQWNFRLVQNLAHRLPYQKVLPEVQAMIQPAEQAFLALQPGLEQAAADLHRRDGAKAAEAFLTAYAADCTSRVGSAYSELVDHLMLRFLVGDPEFARAVPPRIATPTVPPPVLP